jgi:hypothetical protein
MAGLNQHRSKMHPDEYNEEKMRLLPKFTYNWTTLDDATLIAYANYIYDSPDMQLPLLYQCLEPHFPSRSRRGIEQRLKTLKWQQPDFTTSGRQTGPSSRNPSGPASAAPVPSTSRASVQQIPISRGQLSKNIAAATSNGYSLTNLPSLLI